MASRLSRLGAKIIDVIMLYLLFWSFIPNYFFDARRIDMAITVLGFIAYVLQIVWLSKYGQSIGKKIFKIKIIKIATGDNGGFVTNIILRGWLNSIISIIPIYAMVDILYIFNSEKRCVHDFIAGTKVIKV